MELQSIQLLGLGTKTTSTMRNMPFVGEKPFCQEETAAGNGKAEGGQWAKIPDTLPPQVRLLFLFLFIFKNILLHVYIYIYIYFILILLFSFLSILTAKQFFSFTFLKIRFNFQFLRPNRNCQIKFTLMFYEKNALKYKMYMNQLIKIINLWAWRM